MIPQKKNRKVFSLNEHKLQKLMLAQLSHLIHSYLLCKKRGCTIRLYILESSSVDVFSQLLIVPNSFCSWGSVARPRALAEAEHPHFQPPLQSSRPTDTMRQWPFSAGERTSLGLCPRGRCLELRSLHFRRTPHLWPHHLQGAGWRTFPTTRTAGAVAPARRETKWSLQEQAGS